MVDTIPGKPQKRTPSGHIIERELSYCCGFVRVGTVTALCCADLTTCMSDGG